MVFINTEPRGPSQLIEIPVTTAGLSRIAIPDVQQLRSVANQLIVTKFMRLITLDVLSNGVLSGFVNAPVTELQKITLVLYCQGWEKGQFIPVLSLNDTATAASAFARRFQETRFDSWANIDWSKSYLQYSAGTSSVVAANYVVMFDVGYQKFDAATQKVIEGAS